MLLFLLVFICFIIFSFVLVNANANEKIIKQINKYGGKKHKFNTKFNTEITKWKHNYSLAKLMILEFNYTDEEKKLILDISKSEQDYINPYNDLINLIEYKSIKLQHNKNKFPQIFLTHNCYFRKFLLTQVSVLTKFYKKKLSVLYISASNAIFLPFLISLFPSFIWHIYYDIDLSYELSLSTNVHKYNKKFTEEDAKQWHGKVDIVISHHRQSLDYIMKTKKVRFSDEEKHEEKHEEKRDLKHDLKHVSPHAANDQANNQANNAASIFDKMMLNDFNEQSKLIKLIEPKLGASLKFKLPFVDKNDKSTIDIIQGKILWLPWTNPASTDATLIIEGKDAKINSPTMKIHLKTLQDSFATHNMINRVWGYYKPPCNVDHIIGYDYCFDCTLEATIWRDYIDLSSKFAFDNTLTTATTANATWQKHTVSSLMNAINFKFEPLISIVNKSDQHGRHPKLLPAERVKLLIKNKTKFNWAEYEDELKKNVLKYDEFNDTAMDTTIDTAIDTAMNTETKVGNFKYDFAYNLKIAEKLLNTKFKSLYSEREIKYILSVSKKEWPLPSIWNSLISKIPYRGNKGGALAHNIIYSHLGQRKLFMTELQLLTRFLNTALDHAIVLYAGAAPSIHLPLLFELFPNIIWHLYDPAKFAIKESKHAKIYNDFFTHDTAKLWHKKCDIFICDIRLSSENNIEFEKQVMSDMKKQDEWTRIIEPSMGASLKFRLPYISADENINVFKYSRGKILWQMWPPQASTECRLIVEAKDAKKGAPSMEIDVVKYQNACMEHNMIDRAWKTYQIPHPDVKNVLGYDRCFDCTCEAMSWLSYMKLNDSIKKSLSSHMNALTRITYQPLCGKKTKHGYHQFDTASVRISKII